MENIINRILQIDRQAEQKIDAARQQRDEMLASIDTERDALLGELATSHEEKLEMIRKTENAHADAKIEEIARNKAEGIAAMEQMYEQKHAAWAEALYKRVLHDA